MTENREHWQMRLEAALNEASFHHVTAQFISGIDELVQNAERSDTVWSKPEEEK